MIEGVRVVDAGLFTTVQDLGRLGYREWGVSVGGSFDGRSAGIANALLGNPRECAVLEATLSGGVFEACCPLAFAIAGASVDATILGADGHERRFRTPGCGMIRLGEKLVLGPIRNGARAYLAVKEGWQSPIRLGSRSSEQRLAAGDTLLVMRSDLEVPSRHLREWGWVEPERDPIRIVDGPDRDWLEDDTDCWDCHAWRVGSRSNRMGLRLEGAPVALTAAASPDRLSAPVAPGAIQVAGGQLLLLGVACGTMGGYPHVAHVISSDLGRLGQLRPGDPVRFRRVTLAEARCIDRSSRAADRSLIARISLAAGDSGFLPRIDSF